MYKLNVKIYKTLHYKLNKYKKNKPKNPLQRFMVSIQKVTVWHNGYQNPINLKLQPSINSFLYIFLNLIDNYEILFMFNVEYK